MRLSDCCWFRWVRIEESMEEASELPVLPSEEEESSLILPSEDEAEA